MLIMTTTFVALATLLGASNAHMIMSTPSPYNHHKSSPLVQVDPLGASLPFPCQGLSIIEETTALTAGATQRVAFTGGAQHGGGSCQFSLTYEYPPPADKSKWKAIYTLIGGCPVSAAGNLPAAAPDADGRANSPQCGNDSGVECIREFQVPIPKDLPSGNATFAWTWYPKIGGQPELYMTCSPVTILGGSADTAFFDTLPQMFVANVAGECKTGTGVVNIPNPGKFGRVLEQPSPDSQGSCPKAAGVPVFENDAGGAAPAASIDPTTLLTVTRPASSSSPPTDVPAASTTFPGGRSSPCKPAPDPVAPNAPVRPTGDAAVGDAQGCSVVGEIICIGDSQFGICDGAKAVPQDLSDGTTCSGGKIARV